MSGLRKSETQELIRSLVAQGCRAEWSGAGIRGNVTAAGFRFPVKLYPPDPTKHFILVHETLSDTNSVTLKRADVRRAGLTWPFDDKKKTKALEKATSRKEKPMSDPAPAGLREHGTHLVVPPGVRNRTTDPQQVALDAVRPYVAGMAGAFWTDELVAKLKAAGIPGFNAKTGGASVQRAQDLLDWLGYRVMESRPNRGGSSYRWVKEAEERPGRTEARVTALRGPAGSAAASSIGGVDRGVFVEKPKPAPTDKYNGGAPRVIATGAEHKTKYGRKQCETCQRWFTEDGYERHIEATQHGENKPVVASTTEITAEARAAIEALRGGPVDLEQALVVVPADQRPDIAVPMVSRSDYEAMEALATEAQEEATSLRGQLADASETIAKMQRVIDDGTEATTSAEADRDRFQMEATEAREIANAESEARRRERELDDSWVLDLEENAQTYVSMLVKNAERMGITIEIRARRTR